MWRVLTIPGQAAGPWSASQVILRTVWVVLRRYTNRISFPGVILQIGNLDITAQWTSADSAGVSTVERVVWWNCWNITSLSLMNSQDRAQCLCANTFWLTPLYSLREAALWYFILICYLYHASRITIMAIKYTKAVSTSDLKWKVWHVITSCTGRKESRAGREPYWDWHITSHKSANWNWLHIILSPSQLDGFQSTVLEIISFQSIGPLEESWVQVIVTVWHCDVWRVMACCSVLSRVCHWLGSTVLSSSLSPIPG